MFRTILLFITFGILTAGCAWMGGTHGREERITFQPDSTISTPDPNLPNPDEFIAVDEHPVQIYGEPPIYPVAARRANVTGSVMVQAFVDPQGKVLKANALKCDRPGYGFEIAAVAAAYKGKWRPATVNGKPIGMWVTYKVDFAHH
ncbi:MAG: energy transducer TonB [candidate division Zixibacteria bacterium]|nr:energy transducer TonB [candidate division Zixibacteria bacterium]